ncbi:hypothetical protein NKR23_g12480 [Pleurostoma richardsiae]|uniref:BTB domain-containing protein n=1 Tax=Pleurostoma richardsiae TaxID=41990 RepID=A0AA38R1L2_9PEZI|nr:hypothetical protein NKR23_g12480 [Pleurostoma richardsiae]
MEGPSEELLNSFKKIYSSGEYSNLTITCNGKRFQVHRAIVCPRSEFFAAALRQGFKEAGEGTIDLSSDDLHTVEIMIQYFYCLDYDVFSQGQQPDNGNNKLQVLEKSRPPLLSTHAKVYAIGEKYLIGGLKALALRKFNAAITTHWARDDFLEAVREAYGSTPDTDRGLRNSVIAAIHAHSELLKQEQVQSVLKEFNVLAYDLLITQEALEQIRCPYAAKLTISHMECCTLTRSGKHYTKSL